ncbi:MAG: apolipoprotein N-acyltransferase [Pseudomonadota bacterium]
MMDRLARLFGILSSWPTFASLFLGAMAATGFPPVGLWPIAVLALVLFLRLLGQATDWRSATWYGWLFGWAHLTVANNWIATAFTYQAKMPEYLGWIAVPLLAVYLAIYPALAALIAHLVHRKFAPAKSGSLTFGLLFAAAWIVTEWIRGWAFTGYPWPPLGMVLLGGPQSPGFAHLLPWLGTYALSGLAILLAANLLWFWNGGKWHRASLVLQLAVFATIMHNTQSVLPGEGETDIPIALIQPYIPQDEINDPTKFEEHFQRIAELSAPGSSEPRLVLWPESAIPDYLEDGYPRRYYAAKTAAADPGFARRRIGNLVGQDSILLTGVVNLNIGERPDGLTGAVSARNSVIALNGLGEITNHYAKAHLVPYGEYLPLKEWLEPIGLSRLVEGTIEYEPGPGPRTLDLAQFGKAGVQVCYEIVFSGQVVDRVNRPDYIFNPSIDGWFGTWGPPQHLAQARMRAIEEGLPVLRSTTTGISAVIDANGIVRQSIGMDRPGRIDAMIPKAHAPTLFARFGNALSLSWAGILVLLGLGVSRLVARRQRQG